ncbi:unnamed protein product [Ectocarpus sp. CCAP 1310/34]|nr:unnamed protein product [Ectocarpus sp. CCAP 1310/34]
MRKDMECCFGRVKGRWRLFGGDILFSTRQKVDNAWFTACILHNMLHSFNRLDEMEEDADWVGSAGGLGEATAVAAAMDVDEESETPTCGFEEFRRKLIAHFTCAWGKEILWFKRAEVKNIRGACSRQGMGGGVVVVFLA